MEKLTDYQRLLNLIKGLKELVRNDDNSSEQERLGHEIHYFCEIYGEDSLPDDIKNLPFDVLGVPAKRGSWADTGRWIESCFVTLKKRIADKSYIPIAPTMEKTVEDVDSLLSELRQIYRLAKNNSTTLEQLKHAVLDNGFIDKAQKAVDSVTKLKNLQQEMNLGFNRVLALNEGTAELSTKDAAKLYEVTEKTIQNWKNGSVHCEYWPSGGRTTMQEWYRQAQLYKSQHTQSNEDLQIGMTDQQGKGHLDIADIGNGMHIE